MSKFKVGDRVSITGGYHVGSRGRIVQRAHADVRPHLQWVVKLDAPVRTVIGPMSELGFAESDLGAWTVPEEARPLTVGALQDFARGNELPRIEIAGVVSPGVCVIKPASRPLKKPPQGDQ